MIRPMAGPQAHRATAPNLVARILRISVSNRVHPVALHFPVSLLTLLVVYRESMQSCRQHH